MYLAIDTITRKQLVCKLVNLDLIRGKNYQSRLQRGHQEADILRQLQHVSEFLAMRMGQPLTKSSPISSLT